MRAPTRRLARPRRRQLPTAEPDGVDPVVAKVRVPDFQMHAAPHDVRIEAWNKTDGYRQ